MAGPAVEQFWQDYKNRDVQVLAFDFWNGSPLSVAGYIGASGATYPLLMNAGLLSSSSSYGIQYDNYVIVDRTGIVRYTSLNEVFTGLGRWNDTVVRSVTAQWLPKAVEERSWSAMKALYADAETPAPPIPVRVNP